VDATIFKDNLELFFCPQKVESTPSKDAQKYSFFSLKFSFSDKATNVKTIMKIAKKLIFTALELPK
jgi:hypothetical protein